MYLCSTKRYGNLLSYSILFLVRYETTADPGVAFIQGTCLNTVNSIFHGVSRTRKHRTRKVQYQQQGSAKVMTEQDLMQFQCHKSLEHEQHPTW